MTKARVGRLRGSSFSSISPRSGSRLYAPDEEIGEGAYLLANEIGSRPIGPCRPDRSFNLFPEFRGDSVVVLVRRRDTRR